MVQVLMVTENEEEHGLVNTVANSVRAEDGYKNMEPAVKERVLKKEKRNAEIVKGRYIHHRGMHERLDKMYCAGPGRPIQKYHLVPGYTYDLPRGFIDEVNSNRGLEVRAGLVSQDGKNVNGGNPLPKDASPLKLHEIVPVTF
jgi:hypothetical protein